MAQTEQYIKDLWTEMLPTGWSGRNTQDFKATMYSPGSTLFDARLPRTFKTRFFKKLEIEFGLCFPLSAKGKPWDFDEFVDYVESRISKPTVNRKLAMDYLNSEAKVWILQLAFPAVVLAPLYLLAPIWIFAAVLLVFYLPYAFFVVWNALLGMMHWRRVLQRIDKLYLS